MSERPGGKTGPKNNQNSPQRIEERQKLAAAKADLAKQVRMAQKTYSHAVMLANDRLDMAKRELKLLAPRIAKVEPLQGHPDGMFLLTQLRMLRTVYQSIQTMMEVDLDCNVYNLDLVENIARLDQGEDFRLAGRYLTYQEARSRLDLALTYYLWTNILDGADALLRATRNERIVVPWTQEEEDERKARADELREAFKSNRDMAILAGTLASGLAEAQELMEWGVAAVPALDTRNAQIKRELLADVRWAKLNGKLQSVIMELPKRARFHPPLAKLFPMHVNMSMAFEAATDGTVAYGEGTEMAPTRPSAGAMAAANPGAASAAMRAALSAASRGKGGDQLSLGTTRPLGPRPTSPGSSPLGGARSPMPPLGPRQPQTAPLSERPQGLPQAPASPMGDRLPPTAADTGHLPALPSMQERVAAASSGGSSLRLPAVGAPRLPGTTSPGLPGTPGTPMRPVAGRPILPGSHTKPLNPGESPPGVPRKPGT